MQSLTVLGDYNPNGHTAAEVLDALQAVSGSRRWSFRYELLASSGTRVRDLDNVLTGAIEQNWLADIKRIARFTLTESADIDYLSDRIRPWVRLHLPPYDTDDWVEWPQGVFLLASPKRRLEATGRIVREVEGYDQLQVYSDDIVTLRYALAAATVVTTAVQTLLASVLVPPTVRLTPHTGTLAADKEWEPGTSKLRIINDLLGLINYNSLSFDELGVAVVSPYVAPSTRTAEYTYADDQSGLLVPAMDQEMDLFDVPNSWTMVVSEPDQPLLTSTYTNSDPASPTSTVRRQRTITDFRTEQEAVTQAVLDAKVARLAFEASQLYEVVPFFTGMMPIHSGNDVYQLNVGSLAINAKYAEHSWKLPLVAGGRMEHLARRVVTV